MNPDSVKHLGGGPAFPAHHFDMADGEHGLSMRDYFAAKAMHAMTTGSWPDAQESADIAERAYAMADAMLKERSK